MQTTQQPTPANLANITVTQAIQNTIDAEGMDANTL